MTAQSQSGSDSVYTQASTVRVANNNEEAMALAQQEQQHQHQQQQQQQQDYDIQNHPLSCMDSACEAMIDLFGAGNDAQDEEMTTISSMATSTYTTTTNKTLTGMLTWETPQHTTQEEQDPPRVLS